LPLAEPPAKRAIHRPLLARRGLERERGQGDELILVRQRGARKPAGDEARARAKAERGRDVTRSREHAPEEAARSFERRHGCGARRERIERVPSHEPGVQRRPRVRVADVVEHDEVAAQRHQRPDRFGPQAYRPGEFVDLLAPLLVAAAGTRPAVRVPTARRRGAPPTGRPPRSSPAPPPMPGAHKCRHVEDPVLTGAEQFLSGVQQHGNVQWVVDDDEARARRVTRQLANLGAARVPA
jgi:hypothetical protein